MVKDATPLGFGRPTPVLPQYDHPEAIKPYTVTSTTTLCRSRAGGRSSASPDRGGSGQRSFARDAGSTPGFRQSAWMTVPWSRGVSPPSWGSGGWLIRMRLRQNRTSSPWVVMPLVVRGSLGDRGYRLGAD